MYIFKNKYFKKDRIFEFLFVLFNSVFIKFISFLINLFYARLNDIENYGLFLFIRNTLSTVENIFSSTVGNLAIKNISLNIDNRSYINSYLIKYFIYNFITFLFLTLITLIIPKQLFYNYFSLNDFVRIRYILFFILLFLILNTSYFQKIYFTLNLFKDLFFFKIFLNISFVFVYYYFIKWFYFSGAILSLILFYLVDNLFFIITYQRKYKIKNIILENKTQFSFKENGLLLISNLITLLLFWLIRKYYIDTSKSFEAIAIFDTYFQFLTIIMMLTGSISNILLKSLSKVEKNILKSVFIKSVIINLIIIIFLSSFFLIFSNFIISIFGIIFFKYKFLIYYIILISIFASLTSLFNRLFIVLNKIHFILFGTLISTIISISTIFIKISNIPERLCVFFLLYYLTSFLISFILYKFKF